MVQRIRFPVQLSLLMYHNVTPTNTIQRKGFEALINIADTSASVKNTGYNRKIPDTLGFVKKTNYDTKITEIRNKIPNVKVLITIKTDFNAKVTKITKFDTKTKQHYQQSNFK